MYVGEKMNEKVLRIVEFDKIKEQLRSYVSTYYAHNMIDNLVAITSPFELEELHGQCQDALSLIIKIDSPPISTFQNIDDVLQRLNIKGVLSIDEILKTKSILSISARVYDYYKSNSDEIKPSSLIYLFDQISPLKQLYKSIHKIILDEDTIADDASPELKQIRRQIEKVNNAIKEKLNSYISSSSYDNYFQDKIITMKNNRYCIPVKSQHKQRFKGIIQGSSSTGSTLFIEPVAVVELGNKLSSLENDERLEIEKILRDLSLMIADKTDEITYNINALGELDFLFAKAKFALDKKCVKPVFSEEKKFHLRKARHPLLDSKEVIPIDIYLGDGFNTLIITGPNTGGKTVALKTVGLLQIMAMSGLFIPCHETSRVAIFDEIYADIGDEQSIEQSLSTFSAHMVNIIDILKNATENDLILFDELGAGTDPVEGAALAMAILEFIKSKNIMSIATTHYSELKMYALSTEGVENASCEFDIASLKPTYKLLIGVPGKSNAFAISKRLGLKDDVLSIAKAKLETGDIEFEDVMVELETNKRLAKEEREKAEKLLQENIHEQKRLASDRENFLLKKERILDKAKREALDIVENAKKQADEIISSLRKSESNIDFKQIEKDRERLRDSIKSLTKKEESDSVKGDYITDVEIGETVLVKSLGAKGVITDISNDKKEATVKLGILNSTVSLSDIAKTDTSSKQQKKKVRVTQSVRKTSSIKTSLDLRGKLTHEGTELLEKYLDDAYLSSLGQVTIIHGKGSGAMRDAVHRYLKKINYIKSYRLGNYGEGDVGVTIVEFK